MICSCASQYRYRPGDDDDTRSGEAEAKAKTERQTSDPQGNETRTEERASPGKSGEEETQSSDSKGGTKEGPEQAETRTAKSTSSGKSDGRKPQPSDTKGASQEESKLCGEKEGSEFGVTKPKRKTTNSKAVHDLLMEVCTAPKGGTCNYEMVTLCLNAQQIAGQDDWHKKKTKGAKTAKLLAKMDVYMSFVQKVLSQYEKTWVKAIEKGWDFQHHLGVLTSIGKADLSGYMSERLSALKKRIKKVESDARKDIFVKMYSVLERLSEQVKQPSGSLRDFQENVSAKLEEYKNLKTKLEFAE
jgi:hypothetical protein